MHTLLSGEVAVLRADVLELLRIGVHDLNIAREVLIAVDFREVIERFVSDLGHIELVVSNGQEIVVDILKDRIRNVAVGHGGIT